MSGIRRYVVAALVAVAAIAGAVGASAGTGTGNGTKPPRLQFLGQAIVPTGHDVRRHDDRRSLEHHLRRAARRLLQPLGRPEPDQPGALLHAGRRRLRRPSRQRRRHFTGVDDAARAERAAVPAGQPRPGRADADEGRRADRHLGGHRQQRHRRRSCGATRSTGRSSATCRCPAAFLPTERDARRAPEPRVRGGRGRARRPAPVRRHGGRARPGRPGRDGRRTAARRASCATTSRRAGSSGRTSTRRPGRRAARAADQLLGQRPRRAAAVQRRVHARDGALVLGRRARDGQHDQALHVVVHEGDERDGARQHRRGSEAAARAEDAAARPAHARASRSTTSRA